MLSQWLCDSVSVTRCNGVTCDIALVTLVITAYSSLQPGPTSSTPLFRSSPIMCVLLGRTFSVM